MAKLKDDLLLHQALELRASWDKQIALLKTVFESGKVKRDMFSLRSESDMRDYDDDFDYKATEETLKVLETKRVKLNQAIQLCNFSSTFPYGGENISLAEALEMRKALMADLEALSGRCSKSAFKEIVHKEERDIVYRPRQFFKETWKEYLNRLEALRELNNLIHAQNHTVLVKFKDEGGSRE
jgi:hypothetical protein